ncbi:hypothetical protein F4809DRAFT_239794 [Biscogniauxia mediterranea]|nr:hypothetical protein F4809DRAFT_239794 [Biscogniauxia mediterranea]
MAPSKYHKFRGGERCDECGARQWYAQDALRYCRNGHRLEGFAAHEADEDDFGTQGKVSRKKREARSKVRLKLTGDQGRALYLETAQLLLARLARALVDRLGFPAELEDVVRALWALRVRDLSATLADAEGGEKEEEMFFSSQSEGGEPDEDGAAATWTPDAARRRWKMPKMMDLLALCYLGCLVRRLPVTTGDFHRWAQRGDIDFLAAFNDIPRNVRDRLPAEYHRALQVRDHLEPGKLRTVVQGLVVAYKVNYDMVFPPLNHVPVLIRYITELTLPVETYLAAKCIAEILETDYSYPVGSKRVRMMDNPEVLLVTLVVVSAKLLYSPDGVERLPRNHQDPRKIKIDWVKWQEVMRREEGEEGQRGSHLIRGEEYKVTPNDVLSMDETKLDDFMDWFEKMWIGDGDPRTAERIREPFLGEKRPTSPEPPQPPGSSATYTTGEQIRRRYEVLNSSVRYLEPAQADKHPHDNNNDEEDDDDEGEEGDGNNAEDPARNPRDFCPIWRTEEDLPPAAKVLYSRAADLAGIPLSNVVRCATQVERRLEVWSSGRTKEEDRRRRDKGKGKVVLMDTGDDYDYE